MTSEQLYDEPTEVTAKNGEVILDGPDGVDVKVTPEAAEETGERLILKSLQARGQRRLRSMPHQPK